MACEDFKKTTSAAKMAEKAKKIYEEFIRAEAPKEVGPQGVSVVRRLPRRRPGGPRLGDGVQPTAPLTGSGHRS